MKRICLLIFMLVTPLFLRAGEPYFCLNPSASLYYERYSAADPGKLVRTTVFDIGRVRVQADGRRRVDYGLTVRKANGKPMYGGKAEMYMLIGKDNSVSIDSGVSLAVIVKNMVPGVKITSEGSPSVLPADMKPGDKLPDAHCVVDAAGLKYKVDVTQREVLRAEEITVPAGTFSAVVVREHKIEDGPLHHRNVWSDSWYVRGIGYVRHDTYDRNKKLETVEVLVSM